VAEDPGRREALVVRTGVAGARVVAWFRLFGSGADPAPLQTVADGAGVARFECAVDPALVAFKDVEARAHGCAPARARTRGVDLALPLETAVSVRGTVRGFDGSPLAGASVALDGGGSVRSDDAGAFEVFSPPGRSPQRLVVFHRGHVAAELPVAVPSEGVVVDLARGAAIAGSVLYPDGTPAAGAYVGTADGDRGTRCDATGRFTLWGIESGEVELTCPLADERRVVAAGTGEVRFTATRSMVRVRVLDAAGRPFRNAGISWTCRRDGAVVAGGGSTGEDLEDRSIVSPPGCTLVVEARAGESFATARAAVPDRPGPTELSVVFGSGSYGRSLHVRLEGEGAAGPERIFVTAYGEDGSVLEGFEDRPFALAPTGEAAIGPLPQGARRARVSPRGTGSPAEDFLLPTVVDLEGGATEAAPVPVRFPTGGHLAVRFPEPDGSPSCSFRVFDDAGKDAGVRFWVKKGEEWMSRSGMAGPGRSGEPLPPGKYVVRLLRGGSPQASRDVVVLAGQVAEVEFADGR